MKLNGTLPSLLSCDDTGGNCAAFSALAYLVRRTVHIAHTTPDNAQSANTERPTDTPMMLAVVNRKPWSGVTLDAVTVTVTVDDAVILSVCVEETEGLYEEERVLESVTVLLTVQLWE